MFCDLNQIGENKYQCQREGCGRIITPKSVQPVEALRYVCRVGRSEVQRAQNRVALRDGPGAILHKLINHLTHERITATCQCKSRINQMNSWGPSGCREHLGEIVDWLSKEATKRGWRMAKWKTGKLGIRLMVLYAIRKAERAQRR